MTGKVPVAESTQEPIRVAASTQRPVAAQDVAAALGGEAFAERLEDVLAPITLLALREELLRRLQSSGGRPGLSGITRRAKIALSDEEWLELEELAAAVSSPGFAPSAGQVATVLLSLSVQSVASRLLGGPSGQSCAPSSRELATLAAAQTDVVVGGYTDGMILRAVLPENVQKNTTLLIAGERGSLPSVARTLLVTAHKPVAVLVDTDSLDQAIIQDRLQTTEELLKSVSGRIPVKVIPLIPTIEAVFFEACGLLQKLFPSGVTNELMLLAQHDPKEALAQLMGKPPGQREIGWLLDQLDSEDVDKLRATRPMREQLDFVSQILLMATPA